MTHHNHPTPRSTLGLPLSAAHSTGLDKCTRAYTGIHHSVIIQSIFTALNILSALPTHVLLPLATPDLFVSTVLQTFIQSEPYNM